MHKFPAVVATVVLASLATQVRAQVLLASPAPTSPITTHGSLSNTFNSPARGGSAVFDIKGFVSLVEFGNCCSVFFAPYLNSSPIYAATFDFAGGGTDATLFKPVGATEAAMSFGAPASGQTGILGQLASRFEP